MFEAIADWIVDQETRRPYVVLGILALITVILLPGMLQLPGNIEPSIEKVLPTDLDEIETMEYMRGHFNADITYILIRPELPYTDIRNPDILRYMKTLGAKLETHDHIRSVRTPADTFETIPDSIHATRPKITPSQLVNDDYSLAVMELRADIGNDADVINTVLAGIRNDIASMDDPGVTTTVTGFSAIDKATFNYIMSDFARITGVSMALIFLVVYLAFGTLRQSLLPMSVVMLSLAWTMGIVGYLGLTITVVSMVAAAMILGLGIDFGIHIVHTYHANRNDHDPATALRHTKHELLRAMVGSSTTTMSGFLALLFGVLPAMQVLAIILALGIFNTLIGAVWLLPTITYLTDSEVPQ
jgi:hypothetical protein